MSVRAATRFYAVVVACGLLLGLASQPVLAVSPATVEVTVDREKALRFGLEPDQLARELRNRIHQRRPQLDVELVPPPAAATPEDTPDPQRGRASKTRRRGGREKT